MSATLGAAGSSHRAARRPVRWEDLGSVNRAYASDAYERFVQDAAAVDAPLRAFFEAAGPPPAWVDGSPGPDRESNGDPRAGSGTLTPAPLQGANGAGQAAELVAAVGELAAAIREYGHLAARLDPLAGTSPSNVGYADPELDPATHGLSDADLARLPAAAVKLAGTTAQGLVTAKDAIEALRRIYCGTTAYDYDQVQDGRERAWLRDAAEQGWFGPPADPVNPHAILDRLSEVGAFERFLQRTFPGQTRFSIEGTGMLIPILDEIIGAAAEADIRSVLIGMAHRGRLNVLAHVLGKPHVEILEEFKHPSPRPGISWSGGSGEAFSGDVKYHLGHRRAVYSGQRVEMQVTLAPNPSHLEYVNPVVEGMSRAAGERRDRPGPPEQDPAVSLPVLIHGDAAFPGQGIVAETLNLSRLPGYSTGGTIHIIVNNQLGFTAEPGDVRSTLYASDLAKGFEIPIVHVNADDPEACIAAARLAHAYREEFHKDFLIDLIGYRRWGHNEGDDPSMTQPQMYARIAKHPTVRELWGNEMVRRGLVSQEQVEALLASRTAELQEAMRQVNERLEREPGDASAAPSTQTVEPLRRHESAAEAGADPAEVETGVPLEQLRAMHESLFAVPAGFTPHPRVDRLTMQPRRAAFSAEAGRGVDWGHGEALACASILADGTPIRLTGQDSERGTFGQRHAVLHDYATGQKHTPLQRLPQARASFEIRDSPLSEGAVVGFEFGYSVQAPEALVLWEAQYGDFVNSAQVMIDQFVVSARTKWAQEPSLVLLLPHGYEGQGPEHSSARLERFLELAAEGNIRVANCTTAAQYFHLLRRQARLLRDLPRPLVVMTPKSLLRHPLAFSPLAELGQGTRFQPVLDDPFFAGERVAQRGDVRRAVLCSGKVYVDLAASEARASAPQLAIIRVEQLYRFPSRTIERVLAGYPRLEDVAWLQEEPQNMGAWTFVVPRLQAVLAARTLPLRYIGRPERASPSEGTPAWHAAEQARIVADAFAGLSAEPHAQIATERPETAAPRDPASKVTS